MVYCQLCENNYYNNELKERATIIHRLIFGLILLFVSITCCANVSVCNKTSQEVSVAAMQQNYGGDWISYGWYRLGVGSCGSIITGDTENSFVYFHVRDGSGKTYQRSASDKIVKGCVAQSAFKINSSESCRAVGASEVDFFEVNGGEYFFKTINIYSDSVNIISKNNNKGLESALANLLAGTVDHSAVDLGNAGVVGFVNELFVYAENTIKQFGGKTFSSYIEATYDNYSRLFLRFSLLRKWAEGGWTSSGFAGWCCYDEG